jgi:hypothetical protein
VKFLTASITAHYGLLEKFMVEIYSIRKNVFAIENLYTSRRLSISKFSLGFKRSEKCSSMSSKAFQIQRSLSEARFNFFVA